MSLAVRSPDGRLPAASLVELSGLPEEVAAEELLESVQTAPSSLAGSRFRPNGWRGQVVDYRADSKQYLVETFTGLRVTVAPENLTTFEPQHPEQGGFHCAWPPEGDVAALASFSSAAASTLAKEDYCVVQLSLSEETTSGATAEVHYGRQKWKRLRKEFEPAYLGRHSKCKTAWLEEMIEEKQEMESPVDALDLYLARFTQLMLPVAPFCMDFMPHSRTSGLLRVPVASGEHVELPEEVSEEDIVRGLVDEHIDFMKRRKLCMILLADGSGGELTLIPKDASKEHVVLNSRAGRLVIFRHDRMSYTYRPDSQEDLVLQAWVMTAPVELKGAVIEGDARARDELYGLLSGPNTPDGRRICAYGVGLNLPGGSQDFLDNYWLSILSGTDGYVKAPLSRFDIDPYTRTGDDWAIGYTYTVHGGFCQEILSFDNDFFKVPYEEAKYMAPACRNLLERGYEALQRSGFSKQTLPGKNIGVYIGHSGDDWACDPRFTSESPQGLAARKWSALGGRICFSLGLKGPQVLTDTACSSALVAYCVGHTALRTVTKAQVGCASDSGITEALMMGANMIPGPGNFINLCGPHMLSVAGRCFTFDASADGFERGEGASGFFVRSVENVTQDAIATVIGACTNQDGRSASMTAPNGPAQQSCIRGSMKEADRQANEITCSELHGTGTALGDPIEVGALRGVMQDRKVPIMQTSAKTHIGHLEANAGQAGIIKCMLMCNACAGSPNCHLFSLNPHLDTHGYPTIFNTELTEYGNQSGYSGVSSFGFGGANARADIFAVASRGSRKTGQKLNLEKVDYMQVMCPFDSGPMHYVDGREVPLPSSRRYHRSKYHADAIRDEFDDYEMNSSLYEGKYQLEAPEEEADDAPEEPITVVGSWDNFKTPAQIQPSNDGDSWSFLVRLGETRCERFQLRLSGDPGKAIYPVARNGSMRTRVIGPWMQGEGNYWLIDGRDDEVPAGSIYRVTFSWGVRLSMRWEVASEALALATQSMQVLGSVTRHKYFVTGSWTSWNCVEMSEVSEAEGQKAWETTVRIGMSRSESFRFVRDQDMEQVIYPARNVQDAEAKVTPVRGPDELCNEKAWRVTGKYGEQVRLRLQIVDALVIVSVQSVAKPAAAWSATSVTGPARHGYYITGTFNQWTPELMSPESGDRPGVYRYRSMVGRGRQERFVILVDEDPGLALYPTTPGGCPPGFAIVAGPGPTEDRDFQIVCLKEGVEFEIILDLNAADKRKVVDIRWHGDRADVESMKMHFFDFFGNALAA